jgi:hypothetical protein
MVVVCLQQNLGVGRLPNSHDETRPILLDCRNLCLCVECQCAWPASQEPKP